VEVPRRPPWSQPPERHTPVGDLRASDADRERVVALLGEAVADGRLSSDEHAERISVAYSARTLGELTGLTADLSPAEAQPILVDDRPLHVLFGSVRRAGRWVVPVRVPLFALLGTIELDLREAVLQRRHIIIDAQLLGGRLRLLVPEGVRVDVTGRTVLCSRDVRVRGGGGGEGPVIEVRGTMVLGSLRARNPKRRWRDRFAKPR
jgi:uncharacterized protein DUF1707